MSLEELFKSDSSNEKIYFDTEIYIESVIEKNSGEEISDVHLNEWIQEYNIIYQSYILER